jgi:hypothetical protein
MANALHEAFRSDLRCGDLDAARLVDLARERLPRMVGSPDDSDEDLVVRIRDPRVFGEFAIPLLGEPGVSPSLRTLLAERTFDLLPLPRGEGDVIVVEARAPARLFDAAAFLAREDRLSVLQVLHLVYAVFLDRGLVSRVGRQVRSSVLAAILGHGEVNEDLRAFFAAMCLASVPEPEAHASFRRILRDPSIPGSLKASLARLAEDPDLARSRLALIAREEGLVPSGAGENEETQVIANIPRLPGRLVPLARRWRLREA